jgi:thymidylate kinase
MPITIVEGPDFAGKTTFCMEKCNELMEQGLRIAYVHFPIRKIDDIIIIDTVDPSTVTTINSDMFSKCKPFISESGVQLNMEEIQDVILDNIVENTDSLLTLHKHDFHVFVDRHIMSNIVYRKIYNLPYPKSGKLEKESITELIELAEQIIITPPDEVLIQRRNTSQIGRGVADESLDSVNEKITNILNANLCYNSIRDYASD